MAEPCTTLLGGLLVALGIVSVGAATGESKENRSQQARQDLEEAKAKRREDYYWERRNRT